MDTRADAPADATQRKALARRLHHLKNDRYHALVHERRIALRPGVERVLDECARSDLVLGIATTTGRANVEALLAATLGDRGIERFRAIVCAEDAPAKKPDPLAYRIALDRLGIDAADALAIEDSPNGLVAARALGIGTVVTRSAYFLDADFSECAAICDDLDSPVVGMARTIGPRIDVEALRTVQALWTASGTRDSPANPRSASRTKN